MKNMRGIGRLSLGLFLCTVIGCGGAEPANTELDDEALGQGGEALELSYRPEFLMVPEGYAESIPYDLNDRGQVVGVCYGDAGVDAFVWSARAGFATLARLAGAESMTAWAINEQGVVAGTAELTPQVRRPVIWEHSGGVRNLGTYGRYVSESPTSSWSVDSGEALAINNRGHVVGWTSAPEFAQVAFLWDAHSGMRLLGTLGGARSQALAVNSLGEVVGTADLPDGSHHAFLWSRGQMRDLGALGSNYSTALAINDLGVVVGYNSTPEGDRAFRWTRAHGMVDIGPAQSEAGGIPSLAAEVNLLGQVVGSAARPGSPNRAVIRHPWSSAWLELPHETPYGTFPAALNNLGVVVGTVITSGDFEPPAHGVIWYPRISF